MASLEASGESETPLGAKAGDLFWQQHDEQEMRRRITSVHSPQATEGSIGSLSYTFTPGEVSSSSRQGHPSAQSSGSGSGSKAFAFKPNAAAGPSPTVQYEGSSPTATSWLSNPQQASPSEAITSRLAGRASQLGSVSSYPVQFQVSARPAESEVTGPSNTSKTSREQLAALHSPSALLRDASKMLRSKAAMSGSSHLPLNHKPLSMAAPGSKGFPVPSAPNCTPVDLAGPDTAKFDQEDLNSTLASYPEAPCALTPESALRLQPQTLDFDSPLPLPKEFDSATPRLHVISPDHGSVVSIGSHCGLQVARPPESYPPSGSPGTRSIEIEPCSPDKTMGMTDEELLEYLGPESGLLTLAQIQANVRDSVTKLTAGRVLQPDVMGAVSDLSMQLAAACADAAADDGSVILGSDADLGADTTVADISQSCGETTAAAAAGQESESSDGLDQSPGHHHSLWVLLYVVGGLFLLLGAFAGATYMHPGFCTYDQAQPCMEAYAAFFASGPEDHTGFKRIARQTRWIVQDLWNFRVKLELPRGADIEHLRAKFPRLPDNDYNRYRQQSVGLDPGLEDLGAGASICPDVAAEIGNTASACSSSFTSVAAGKEDEVAAVEQLDEYQTDVAAPTAAEEIAELPASPDEVSAPAGAEQPADLEVLLQEGSAAAGQAGAGGPPGELGAGSASKLVEGSTEEAPAAGQAGVGGPSDGLGAGSAIELVEGSFEDAPAAAIPSNGDSFPQQEQPQQHATEELELTSEQPLQGNKAEEELEFVMNGSSVSGGILEAGSAAAGDEAVLEADLAAAPLAKQETDSEVDSIAEPAAGADSISEADAVAAEHALEDSEEHKQAAGADLVPGCDSAATDEGADLLPDQNAEATLGLRLSDQEQATAATQELADNATGSVETKTTSAEASPEAQAALQAATATLTEAATAAAGEATVPTTDEQVPPAGPMPTLDAAQIDPAEPIVSTEMAAQPADLTGTAASEPAAPQEEVAANSTAELPTTTTAGGQVAEPAGDEALVTGAVAEGAGVALESEPGLSDLPAAAEEVAMEPQFPAADSEVAVPVEVAMPEAGPMVEEVPTKAPKPRKALWVLVATALALVTLGLGAARFVLASTTAAPATQDAEVFDEYAAGGGPVPGSASGFMGAMEYQILHPVSTPPMSVRALLSLGLPSEPAELVADDAEVHQAGLAAEEPPPAAAPGSARRRFIGRSPAATATASAMKRGARSRLAALKEDEAVALGADVGAAVSDGRAPSEPAPAPSGRRRPSTAAPTSSRGRTRSGADGAVAGSALEDDASTPQSTGVTRAATRRSTRLSAGGL